jgi:hypothetical protein
LRSNGFFAGLLEIYKRIPLVRNLGLDEAMEHVRRPLAPAASFPFTIEQQIRPAVRSDQPSAAGADKSSGPSTPARKTPPSTDEGGARSSGQSTRKRKGITLPMDSGKIRKYGRRKVDEICSPLSEGIRDFASSHPIFAKNPHLSDELEKLLEGSSAERTWKKVPFRVESLD